jgi:hypothetical protein
VNLVRIGASALAGGARRGNPVLAGLGTALLVAGWLRRHAGPRKRLLYARTLRGGETLRIRLVGSDEQLEVEG